jgi:hypothetical protein
MWPNRSADPVTLQNFRMTFLQTAHRFWSGEQGINWFCGELMEPLTSLSDNEAVISDLLRWGMDHGALDRVPVFLFTQPYEKKRYEAVGFEVLDDISCGPSIFTVLRYYNQQNDCQMGLTDSCYCTALGELSDSKF